MRGIPSVLLIKSTFSQQELSSAQPHSPQNALFHHPKHNPPPTLFPHQRRQSWEPRPHPRTPPRVHPHGFQSPLVRLTPLYFHLPKPHQFKLNHPSLPANQGPPNHSPQRYFYRLNLVSLKTANSALCRSIRTYCTGTVSSPSTVNYFDDE